MWGPVWRQARIRWHGFGRTREEFDPFIVKTGRPTLARGTRSCSVKVRQIGNKSSQPQKAPVEWNIISWNRRAAGFLNSKPPADVSKPSGRSMQADRLHE